MEFQSESGITYIVRPIYFGERYGSSWGKVWESDETLIEFLSGAQDDSHPYGHRIRRTVLTTVMSRKREWVLMPANFWALGSPAYVLTSRDVSEVQERLLGEVSWR